MHSEIFLYFAEAKENACINSKNPFSFTNLAAIPKVIFFKGILNLFLSISFFIYYWFEIIYTIRM